MTKPIAYCVDLEEYTLIQVSKILGLDPTDLDFLNIPLYDHPMRELTDDEIEKIGRENLSYWDSYDEGLMLFAKEIQKYMKDKK